MSARYPSSPLSAAEASALEARFGLRLSARLSEGAERLPHEVSERLRAAREQALSRVRHATAAQPAAAGAALSAGPATLVMGDGPGTSWWMRFGVLAPLVVLVAGLLLVQFARRQEQAQAVADVDVALLADAVPPSAYNDPAFIEFLKSPPPAEPVQN